MQVMHTINHPTNVRCIYHLLAFQLELKLDEITLIAWNDSHILERKLFIVQIHLFIQK